MTFTEAYTSLKSLYKNLMFPKVENARKWTPTEIDQLDVHFFHELMDEYIDETPQQPQQQERYLSDVW